MARRIADCSRHNILPLDNEKFGERLRLIMQEKDVSVRQLAFDMDVTERSIYNMLNGKHLPSLETYSNLLQILKIRDVLPLQDSITTPEIINDLLIDQLYHMLSKLEPQYPIMIQNVVDALLQYHDQKIQQQEAPQEVSI